ncbi:hypothetical protein KAR91_52645 [Candidatus Pacearchaeota archaeon]|nr:hypothetical protein [Candidatus Pacearchaeota archaeon]
MLYSETVRIIVQSSGGGEKEYVEFSTDMDCPVEDFIIPGCSLDSENVTDVEIPLGFPLDEVLKKDR